IRDFHVTGVQTCALPISSKWPLIDKVSSATAWRGFVIQSPGPELSTVRISGLRINHAHSSSVESVLRWEDFYEVIQLDDLEIVKIGRASCRDGVQIWVVA